jgi:hypothetical protein
LPTTGTGVRLGHGLSAENAMMNIHTSLPITEPRAALRDGSTLRSPLQSML